MEPTEEAASETQDAAPRRRSSHHGHEHKKRSSSKSRTKTSSKDDLNESGHGTHRRRSASKGRSAKSSGDGDGDDLSHSSHGRKRSSSKSRSKKTTSDGDESMDHSGHGSTRRRSRGKKHEDDALDDLADDLLVDIEELQRQLVEDEKQSSDADKAKSTNGGGSRSASRRSSGHGASKGSRSKNRKGAKSNEGNKILDDDALDAELDLDMEQLQRQLEAEARNQVDSLLQEEKHGAHHGHRPGRKHLHKQGSSRFREGAEERAAKSFDRGNGENSADGVDDSSQTPKQRRKLSLHANMKFSGEAAACMSSNVFGAADFGDFGTEEFDAPVNVSDHDTGAGDDGFGADFANFDDMDDNEEQALQPQKRRSARRRGSGRFRQSTALGRTNSRKEMADEADATGDSAEGDIDVTATGGMMERARLLNSQSNEKSTRSSSLSRQGSRKFERTRGLNRQSSAPFEHHEDDDNDDLDNSTHSAPYTLDDEDDEAARARRDKRELRKALMRERAQRSRLHKEGEAGHPSSPNKTTDETASTDGGIRRVSSTSRLNHSKISMTPSQRK